MNQLYRIPVLLFQLEIIGAFSLFAGGSHIRCCPVVLYNSSVPETPAARLDRVLAQLKLYEHPLLDFSARSKEDGVEVIIQFKDKSIPVHTYYFDLHPRDLDHPQFEWNFQRQLYDALHDYFVEMFIRTPQDRADRRLKEQ